MADNSGARGRGRARGRARGEEMPAAVRQPGQPGPPGFGQMQPAPVPQQSAWGRAARPQAPAAAPAQAGPVAPPVQQMASMSIGGGANGRNGGAAEHAAPSVGRGAVRGGGARESREPRELVRTRPTRGDFNKCGSFGIAVKMTTNYFCVEQLPNMNLLQYRVDFDPDEDRIGVRRALVNNHKELIGKHLFDGTILYCVRRMQNEVTELFSKRISDDTNIRITLKFTKEVHPQDPQYITILNIILRRCTSLLGLTLVGRDYYDEAAGHDVDVKGFRLSVWPGYKTSIRPHETSILLCVDITHKVLRKDTALDIINAAVREAQDRKRDIKGAIKAAIEGNVIMTAYNKMTYKIDDIDFDKTVDSTFLLRKENRQVSYREYYETKYKLRVSNPKQPLLVSRPSRRDLNRGDIEPVFLVPEFCFMTGFSESMRKDFTVMKAVGDYTRETPDQRVEQLYGYLNRMRQNAEIVEQLKSWGMKISDNLAEVTARHIGPEKIVVGGNVVTYKVDRADWSGELRNAKVAAAVPLVHWAVFMPRNFERDASDFLGKMSNVSRSMGFDMKPAQIFPLASDRAMEYTKEMKNQLNKNFVIMVCFVPRPNEMTYNAIKKFTSVENAVLTQVITSKAMAKRESAATKIMYQIVSKIGGEPWRAEIPIKDAMVIGFDAHHNARQTKAYGAMVATYNPELTRYSNFVTEHENNEEMARSLERDVQAALEKYYAVNRSLPGKIFYYRDAVGAGDISRLKENEIAAVKRGLIRSAERYNAQVPKLAFIIVAKRINTRFFQMQGPRKINPLPGTVVDNVVTLWERYDFYLVSQKANQGTVSPTAFHIVEDEINWAPDYHQRLAFKLTHLYYNWMGTLSVPAPIQYAHKLAYHVGENLKAIPNPGLRDFPFYL